MNSQADFKEGKVLFEEVPPKPPDLRRYQGAMFLDRPDLWPSERNARRLSLPHLSSSLSSKRGETPSLPPFRDNLN